MPGLFRWTGRKEGGAADGPVTVQAPLEPRSTSKVLPRFLAALSAVPGPVLLNLGPVVGQNISFFGDRLRCKIIEEDLFGQIDDGALEGSPKPLPQALVARLPHDQESIDGILCWELFDYLDRPTSQILAAHLVSLLRPGGVLYGFFGTAAVEVSHRTRFVVESADTLRLGTLPTRPTRRNVMVTREITKMFDGLAVAETVLLKSNRRETLFRKV